MNDKFVLWMVTSLHQSLLRPVTHYGLQVFDFVEGYTMIYLSDDVCHPVAHVPWKVMFLYQGLVDFQGL